MNEFCRDLVAAMSRIIRTFATNIKFKVIMSFITDKVVMEGLTFDDVLLIPAYSEVLPKTVGLPRLMEAMMLWL